MSATSLVAPGVHKFVTGPFNWYMLEEAGRVTLVDAGFPGHFRVFEDGLRTLGLGIKDVAAVVLTHAHSDHTGFAERVRNLSGAPIYIHGADARAAERPLMLPWFGLLSNAWRPYTAAMLATAVVNGVFTMPRVTRAELLRDGQRLDIPGRPTVLHVPGHTAGQVALLLPGDEVLLSSDTLVTRNLLTGAVTEPFVPSEVLNDDTRLAVSALERFGGLGRVRMLPGHGPAWEGEMGAAVATAKEPAAGRI